MAEEEFSAAKRYGVAGFSVMVALLIRLFFQPWLGNGAPFLTFFPAVLMTAVYGGLHAGIAATLLSAIVADYFLIPPRFSFQVVSLLDMANLIVFVGVGGWTSWLGGTRVRANQARHRSLERELKMQRQLKAVREQFFDVLENISDGFCLLDREWRCTYVNQRMANMARKRQDDLIGQRIWEAFPAVAEPQDDLEFQRVLREGGPIHLENFYAPYDSWYETNIYSTHESFSIFIRDITQRKQAEADLKASEQRLRLAQRSAKIGTWEWNLKTDQVAWSEGIWNLLGREPGCEEPGAKAWMELVHPDDRQRIQQTLTVLLAEGTDYYDEFRIVQPTGAIVWLASKGQVYRDAVGQAERFLGINIDITERKRIEEALQASAERLSLALTAAKLGDWCWDVVTNRITISERTAEILGIPPSTDLTWVQIQRLLHPDDGERAQLELQQALAAQGDYDAEYRAIRPDGEVRWMALKGRVQYDAARRVLSLMGVVQDISDRKHIEQEILTLNQRLKRRVLELQALLDVVPVGIAIAEDPQCRVIRPNPFFQKIFNTTAEGNLSVTETGEQAIPMRRLQNGRELQPDELPMQVAAKQGIEVRNAELQLVRPDGTTFYLLGSATPLFNDQGRVRGSVAVFMDITERKQAEAEREELLKREQVAREQAETANRVKDEFLAVLSHELRTPLNPILGWIKLLRAGKLDAQKSATALETIERNAKLQTQLIEDLLDISRILQGKLTLTVSPVDLKGTIEAATETVRLAAEAKKIQICGQLSPLPGQVMGDANRLQQVIWNLLSNAVKFTPVGGRVDIQLQGIEPSAGWVQPWPQAEAGSRYAQIQVSDTGKGIAPDFLPYVFDTFRQADGTTTRQFGGLGLGLAIVRRIVELHGGTVVADSPGEGGGATFTVWLPLSLSTRGTRPPPASSLTPNLQNIQVLVVDDDRDTREWIDVLLTQAGATVKLAASAAEALSQLTQSPPDILLSDIGMPDVDGYDLIRQIRTYDAAQGGQVPAIALTAYAGDTDQQQALAAGFQKHLPKPISSDELIQAIAQLVSGSPP